MSTIEAPTGIGAGLQLLSVTAPPRLWVTHVDIFLTTVRLCWVTELKARKRDAGVGPITNSAGMYLSAINCQRSVTDQPDPLGF